MSYYKSKPNYFNKTNKPPINNPVSNKSFNNKTISNKMNSNKSSYTKSISNNLSKVNKNKLLKYFIKILTILLFLIIIYIFIFLIKYLTTKCYKKMSFIQYLKNCNFSNVCLLTTKPESQPLIERKIKDEREVFHISNQDYTYNQAKCKCNAYGGRLAKYSEIVDSYNKGAHWCDYGWSDGQNAYYPVQKDLWKTSDKFCGKEPGVNGGFFSNPHIKFGVNCYGIKPAGQVIVPKIPSDDEPDFCSLPVNNQASHKLDSDNIAPFNNTQWSKYT